MIRKLLLGVSFVLLMTGCSTPQPVSTRAPSSDVLTATATRERRSAPPATATPAAVAPAAASPTVAPTATASAIPTLSAATTTPSLLPTAKSGASSAVVPVNLQATLVATGSVMAKSVPSLDPRKYAAPVLLTPEDNAVYHVSQPLVHFTWTNTPNELLRFGQLPQCASDDTNFRKVFESTHVVIHSLDANQPDIVAFMDTGTDYNLNLTKVKPGRYSWSVSVAAVCESYMVGKRNTTIERYYLGPVSPSSASRTFTWIP